MGRQLATLLKSPPFGIGVTIACFQTGGTIPERRLALTIYIINYVVSVRMSVRACVMV